MSEHKSYGDQWKEFWVTIKEDSIDLGGEAKEKWDDFRDRAGDFISTHSDDPREQWDAFRASLEKEGHKYPDAFWDQWDHFTDSVDQTIETYDHHAKGALDDYGFCGVTVTSGDAFSEHLVALHEGTDPLFL